MDAIVTAGGIPDPGDPLYRETGNQPKALLEGSRKAHDPMGFWTRWQVLKKVDRVIVVGLPESTPLVFPRPLTLLPDHGTMLDKTFRPPAQVLIPFHQSEDFILTVSSDIPTVTTYHVN